MLTSEHDGLIMKNMYGAIQVLCYAMMCGGGGGGGVYCSVFEGLVLEAISVTREWGVKFPEKSVM